MNTNSILTLFLIGIVSSSVTRLRAESESVESPANPIPSHLAYAFKAMQEGKFRDAIGEATLALSTNPTNGEALNIRGVAYTHTRDFTNAIADFNAALRLQPTNGYLYLSLAGAHSAQESFGAAISNYTKGLSLVSDNVSARVSRGNAYARTGQFALAASDYSKAWSADPNHLDLLNNYAWFLATCPDKALRDGKRAVTMATKACELLQWKNYVALDSLAAAQAEVGLFEQAIQSQRQALSMVNESDLREIAEMKERLALYEARKAFRVNEGGR